MLRQRPVAVIDIGSNSVRLVVYSGRGRVPLPIFNEKVLAGLGAGLAESGRLSEESRDCALRTLRRFKLLTRHMGVGKVEVIATAAVRDAADGAEFVAAVEDIGFDCKVLPASEEARLAGEGVLYAIPGADGVVADLGGGSLELVEVAGGRPRPGISLPLGVLRIRPQGKGEAIASRTVREALGATGLGAAAQGRRLYLVGGSWRALARVDMIATGYPLPVTHQYGIQPSRVAELRRLVAAPEQPWAKAIATARLASLPAAAMLLELLTAELGPAEIILSSSGIREGLLFSSLAESARRLDPLIEAAREAGGGEHRFGEHGDVLEEWLGQVFESDGPEARRIRRASCLLADVAWQASPDFRADRGVEMALHGDWIGVTATERVMMAQALSASFGRERLREASMAALCTPAALERARHWGLAMRLGQRLSGGVGSALHGSRLTLGPGALQLRIRRAEVALVGDPVTRRLGKLAAALGRAPEVVPV